MSASRSASGTVGDMSVTVADNPMESRYEAQIDGVLVGVSQYELTADTIVFLHTVVRQENEGQGVGGAIARFALDDARARGLQVRPLCPYIRAWLARHPEYGDLISTSG
jgi:predicted GNAT family acetyltransferase